MTREKRIVMLGFLAAASACTNSGLKDYNEATVDNCNELCAEAQANLAPDGCYVDCDIGIAADYDGQANLLFFNLADIALGVDVDGGGTCDLVVGCGGEADCLAALDKAMKDSSGDTAEAMKAYDDCVITAQEGVCGRQFDDCTDMGPQVYQDCLDAGSDVAYCDCLMQAHNDSCLCEYDACVVQDEDPECLPPEEACDDPEARIMPPVQTGPGRFTVSRRFIDQQMARGQALAIETGVWPVRDVVTKEWRGVRLREVDGSNVLHQIGLRSDDILLRANGLSVLKAYTQPAALLQLRSAAQIQLVLERNGQNRQLVYTLVP